MPGSYLRTNYRKTGGVLDITALGGLYPLASVHGGAGTPLAYGGVIYYRSWSGSIGGSTRTWSNWVADSTYGLLSAMYGDYTPGSGYKFMPIFVNWRSISDANLLSVAQCATAVGGGLGAQPFFSGSFTGSIFVINVGPRWNYGGGTGSALTAVSMSGQHFLADLFGLIVSGP